MGIAIGGSNDWWINLVAGLLSVLVAALLGKAAKKG